MKSKAWESLTRNKLTINQTDTELEVGYAEVEGFYEPLAVYLLGRLKTGERLMVAVAGPPGSGKSAFAAILAAVINALVSDHVAACIGLDGWHYPNDYLETHSIDRNGNTVVLKQIKGAPETFDVLSAYACLELIRSDEEAIYPVYSRQLHDPIPEGGRIEREQRIAIIEGNYWLLDESPWRDYQPMFDVKIFLRADADNLVAGLRQRHQKGGKTADAVEKHLKNVDLTNIQRVLANSVEADILVEKIDSKRISNLRWLRP